MKWMRVLTFTGFLAVTLSGMAAAQEKKEGIDELAAELAASVRPVAEKYRPGTGVKIGYFTPSGIDSANGGGAFEAALALALGTFVNTESPLELKGDFYYLEDEKKPALKIIKVNAELKDTKKGANVKEFTPFVGFIRSNGDIARITGKTVSFKSDAEYAGPPSEERNKQMQQDPTTAVEGTLVKARKDSPYAVEIRTKSLNGTGATVPRKATLENGLAFVPIDKGELYEVRVVNNADHEIAVSLSIDGIDQFTFSEDRKADGTPRFSHWIVGPRKDVIIYGWHRTADRSGRTTSGRSW